MQSRSITLFVLGVYNLDIKWLIKTRKKRYAFCKYIFTCVLTVLHKLGNLLITPKHTTQLTTYGFKGLHTNFGYCTT